MIPATNKIICADCLSVMKDWDDNCVDLVFCSPPYEDARTYGIDFNLKGQAWVDWALPRFLECVRVCKGLVAWVVEGKTKNYRWTATPALLMADLHRSGIALRKPPAFHRVGIPGSGGPDWLRNDYEFIVCATSGGKLPWSDNTVMGHPPKWAPGGEMSHRISDGSRVSQWGGGMKHPCGPRKKDGSRGTNERPSHKLATKSETPLMTPSQTQRENGAKGNPGYEPPKIANPGNVIKMHVGGGAMGSKKAHENEAPFPEQLAEFFIKSFCAPERIVLDPFIGSGTTAAISERFGRRWIGIDIRESQVELSRKRMEEEKSKLALFT